MGSSFRGRPFLSAKDSPTASAASGSWPFSMSDAKALDALPPLPLALLVVGSALTVASHTLWLPLWFSIAAGTLLLWRAVIAIRGSSLPPRLARGQGASSNRD